MANKKKRTVLSLLLVFCLIIQAKAQPSALTIADSLYNFGDYTNAIKKYQEIVPKDQYTLLQIAKSHRAKGTYTDALSYYKQVLKTTNLTTSVKLEYAKLLMITGKLKKADSMYTDLVLKHPKNPDFQYRLGVIKKRQKDTLAISYFKEAFRLDSTHQKSCFEISKNYLKKRNYDMVLKTANIGLRSYSENVELIGVLGQNFLFRKDYDNALPYFQKLLKLNQENEFIHSKLGLCYSKTHEYKKAISHFNEVLKYNNKSPNTYSLLGYAYQQLKKYDNALEYYKKALALKDTPLEEDLLSIALIYRFQEKWKKAIQYAKLAIKEDPNNTRAHYQLAMFADAYYQDPEIKLKYYNNYLEKFDTDKKDYFNMIVKKRIAQLEEEIQNKTKTK
ncbi:tetratricopeptide repeat protein [Aquimarina sp. Aq78]|uniref:tetratricopeptide repeat protein n=1 Tax=Aquimarina sp. Aq78 TaxID=1191889 RepID=UPI000D0EEB59|nr:tetratricopeptide repeat protein [Aquimarina sp. Aq78]